MLRYVFSLLIASFLLVSASTQAQAKRVALVIGNSDYVHASRLPNPENDARDLAAAFTALGYEVQMVEDATRGALLDALRSFRARSLGADHSVIYYAGHGIEIDRQNFVVPVDAVLEADIDVEYETVPMDLLVAATSGARDLSLVVLDACRDNPFLQRMTRSLATRNIGRGLAIYEPDGNSLVAYAAREGTVALDGTGKNSPYAQAFLAALEKPDLEIGQFFRQVRDRVIEKTNGQQEPFLYGSLSAKPVFFRPQQDVAQAAPAPAIVTPPKQEDRASADTLLSVDLAFWQSIEDSKQPSDFEDYLNRFPDGLFRPLAERRLAALTTPQAPARSSAPQTTPAPAPAPDPPRPASLVPLTPTPQETPAPAPFVLSREEVRDLQARLNILGLNAGGEDGIAGQRTRNAAAAYRTTRGVPGEGIDQLLMEAINAEVSDDRLASYRTARAQAAPKPAPKKTQPQKASKPKPTSKTTTKKKAAPKPKAAGNLAGYVGRSYCRSKDGVLLNGRNLSDRPIWCITVLAIDGSKMRYRVSQRQSAGKPLNQSVFTRARSGTRTYGPVRLASSGSGSLSANGGTFVASSISR